MATSRGLRSLSMTPFLPLPAWHACARWQYLTICAMCRWFLASKAIFVMHFAVALPCAVGLWAMLVIFSMRLRQALTSGKAWSRRRRSGCIYAYTLSIIQVGVRLYTCMRNTWCGTAADEYSSVNVAHAMWRDGRKLNTLPSHSLTRALATLQAVNATCYLVSNSIILFGHCQWFSPAVFWLAFVRWEVRTCLRLIVCLVVWPVTKCPPV